MTNLERWKYYCSDLVSPDSFIEFGYYYIIASALQRRVWRGELLHSPLFPNQYIVFVAPPGVGKGEVSRQVDHVLRANRYMINGAPVSLDGKSFKGLIEVAPKTVTFEALVRLMGQTARAVKLPQGHKPAHYSHCSISFVLDELSSLLRKNTDDTVGFLLQVYDCVHYESMTIGRPTDTIINSCLNLLAGTQPSHIRKIFGSGLLSEGLASRTFFLYEEKKRRIRKDPPKFDDDQKKELLHIIAHVAKLADVFGQVHYTPDAEAYFEMWWNKIQTTPINASPLLAGFRERENMAVVKLAMAVHFGEKLDFVITLDEFIKATQLLEMAEKNMHMALNLEGRNVVAQVSKDIVRHLINCGPTMPRELLIHFYDDLPYPATESLNKILEELKTMGKITNDGMKYIATLK